MDNKFITPPKFPTEGETLYNIEGKVIDYNNAKPLKRVTVQLLKNGEIIAYSLTDDDGKYLLSIILNDHEFESQKPSLLIKYIPSEKNYLQSTYIPLTGAHTIKTVLPEIKLQTKTSHIKEELMTDIVEIPQNIWKKIKDKTKGNVDWVKKFFSEKIEDIFKKLLPIIIELLIKFGIKNINDKKIQCPDKDELLKVIKKRNNLVKALNNIYKALDIIIKVNTVELTLIKLFKMLSKVRINLPIPLKSILFESKIHKTQEFIKSLEKQITKYEGISTVLLVYVFILKESIGLLISYLKILDKNIEECYREQNYNPENPYGFDSYLEPLLEELRSINNSSENGSIDGSIKTIHNGFEIKVINEGKNSIQGVYRRQAIALNPQGVIVLKGEPSFSSDDEILKNELIFYININDLKAD